jgi:hypothetical protein
MLCSRSLQEILGCANPTACLDFARGTSRSGAPNAPIPIAVYTEQISRELEVFYRLDFYISPSGPVFGEFTSSPSGAKGFCLKGKT